MAPAVDRAGSVSGFRGAALEDFARRFSSKIFDENLDGRFSNSPGQGEDFLQIHARSSISEGSTALEVSGTDGSKVQKPFEFLMVLQISFTGFLTFHIIFTYIFTEFFTESFTELFTVSFYKILYTFYNVYIIIYRC